MGRRIPKSRRHKKLKFVDPCFSGRPTNVKKRRLEKNEPPKHEDLQEVPHNMRELIDIKNKVKQNKLKRRSKKKNKLKDDFIIVRREKIENGLPGMTKPLKPVPEKIVQKPNESVSQFFNKLQRMASSAIAEAQVEQKYDVDLYHVDDKNVAVVPSRGDCGETQEAVKKENSSKTSKKKKKVNVADKLEKIFLNDPVKFGEVVQEPPTLLVRPRKSGETKKPGVRNLYLKQMLNNNQDSTVTNKLSGLKQERQEMSDARRRILEEERIRVVDLYRSLKQKNQSFLKT